MKIPSDVLLEWLKLFSSAATPILIAYFGWIFGKRLKSIDHNQWQNRKIIEIRLDLYRELAPKLNSMYCYVMWVGDWKEFSPVEIIALKRSTDKTVNVYRHLFGDDFYKSYNEFIHSMFQTFNGAGEDARIRSDVEGGNGDRRASYKSSWEESWDSKFAPDNKPSRKEIVRFYGNLMEQFRKCIGLGKETSRQ